MLAQLPLNSNVTSELYAVYLFNLNRLIIFERGVIEYQVVDKKAKKLSGCLIEDVIIPAHAGGEHCPEMFL